MHDFNGIEIKKEDLLDSVKAMYKEKRRLVMINGYINENRENVIAYNFDVNGDITTYLVKGEETSINNSHLFSFSKVGRRGNRRNDEYEV